MKRLTKKQMIIFAIGQLGWSILSGIIGAWFVTFYLPTEGDIKAGAHQFIQPGLVILGFLTILGLITALSRVFDAITDPLIANLSDRSQNPKGRRIPFMQKAAIPLSIVTVLLFMMTTVAMADGATFKINEGVVDAATKAKMEKNVTQMMTVFKTAADEQEKKIKLPKENFTPEAIKDIEQMWKASAMSCPPVNIMSRCLKTSSGYQVRGIPIDMVEADQAESRQELTVDFTTDGRISGVSISIDLQRYEEIMGQKESDLDYARRQIIVDFVENFRTAYNRKDIDLLNSVFSDKALIITGKVVKEKPNSDLTRMTLNNNKVVYIKQSKQQYITNLTRVFKNTKYINVKFDEIEVVQHPKYDDVYGVTLKQYWHTSGYSDEGYLFLMIDFRDADNPLIQVRTWQPYKNAEGQVVTKREDVFHLGSFRIVR